MVESEVALNVVEKGVFDVVLAKGDDVNHWGSVDTTKLLEYNAPEEFELYNTRINAISQKYLPKLQELSFKKSLMPKIDNTYVAKTGIPNESIDEYTALLNEYNNQFNNNIINSNLNSNSNTYSKKENDFLAILQYQKANSKLNKLK